MDQVKARLEKHLDALCNQIGERHLGSEGEKKAADYLQRSFESSGHAVVREAFAAPGWKYGAYGLEVVETGESLPCFPCFYSNACDITDTLTVIDPKNFGHLDLKGKVCFAPQKSAARGEGVEDRNELAERLDGMGAVALIVVGRHQDTVDTKVVRTPNLKRLAVMDIAGDTVWDVARNIHRRFRVKIEAENFPTTSSNVIARVAGSPGKKIVIGAHYDTAPGIVGGGDNATGVALTLELARVLKDKTQEYSADFIGFSGEEYGGRGSALGSFEYVNRHIDEIGRIVWMCTFDDVGNPFGQENVHIGRSWRLRQQVDEIVRPHGFKTGDVVLGSDNCSFHHHAIPTLYFGNTSPYKQIHSPKDDLRVVSIDALHHVFEVAVEVITSLLATPPDHFKV
ncbi:MAG: hypothetical protein A3F84_15265 [Candidatus Handelsmanbacteria bacterium RIFCSPLOWO2_12_FULL_64_10]|uniref:Peptidase M28 domain-containing protein n=1 Tax=Handelsmanbacteria sp. (strain RIFCSPLOWO2_12_FULL_64_10) TaxID=1817868 RepID=A0A1F6CS72_HANXR|nr:MAG: hypothetical protein A3F84_15265 [Candidatus Handelsmanbacteria bacterium RIFCSPLOWO2_12_FULL_64_10]